MFDPFGRLLDVLDWIFASFGGAVLPRRVRDHRPSDCRLFFVAEHSKKDYNFSDDVWATKGRRAGI